MSDQPEQVDTVTTAAARRAATAGEQDHSDIAALTGGPADAPEDTGRPSAEPRGTDHPGLDDVVLT
jgi:hypothetical protein